nr:hypothetical protein SHINE37_80089 [Rhizobiaceae bacterium]
MLTDDRRIYDLPTLGQIPGPRQVFVEASEQIVDGADPNIIMRP